MLKNKYIHILLCISFSIILPLTAFAQAPVANFSASKTSGCSPIVTQFTDLSTNSPTSWYWDLGNGTTSTLQNPSTTYFTAGTYTVKLTATNASGSDTKTITNYITVAPSPVVSFTADSSASCSLPRTITFTNNSVPGGSGTATYLWDFGDGTTSTAQNPTKTYTTSGNFTVVLLVTNGNGCQSSLTKPGYIKNAQKPVTAFTAGATVLCAAPFSTTLTNTSTSAVSYLWDFGDGNTSTNANPVHTYAANGTYSIRLISTSAAGCKDTLTRSNYIYVGETIASFNASAGSGCTNKSITLTNTSAPAGYSSTWDFGDATTSTATSPGKAYAAAGTYNIRLIVANNGCADTAYRQVTIAASAKAIFTGSPYLGCSVPHTVNFTNSSSGASGYAWSFGDGNTSTNTSPSHTYTSLGNYNVRLIAFASNGCNDTSVNNNLVKVQQPTATITLGSFSGCAPVTVPFTASVTTNIPVTNYTWNFGDGSTPVSCGSCNTQSHTYTSPGTYTVTLTYSTGPGCTFNVQRNVTISTKPTASFTASPTTICPGSAVTFTNNSTGATSYTWFFGDGGTSNAANPVYNNYIYPVGGGSYTVTLIANNNGCRDTSVRSNYITVLPPRARFGVTLSCSNRFTVTLSDSSLGADTYSWNWGDGNTSTQAGGTLNHTYTSAGTYTITLTVTNTTSGCSHSFSRTVNVRPLVASFIVGDTTLCKNENAGFLATASSVIATYAFSPGDGSGPFSSNIHYLDRAYPAPGIYTVKLVVTDSNGCKDSMVRPNYVRVGGPSVAFSASPTSGCLPLTVNFTDNSTPNGGFAITNREWFYGYGPTTNTSSATSSFTYVNGGSWAVKLIVTDANGCKDSLNKPDYIVTSRPKAQFYTYDTVVCVGKPVVIYNNSGGNNFTCVWYWGDGTTSNLLTPTHTYTTPGVYSIKLVITDALGCKDSVTMTDYVKVLSPAISFTMSDSVANCPPLTVNFTNTSTSVSSYSWTFSNGSQSSLANPTTVYTYPGTYQVKLIGTSVGGCKDSATKNVVVNGPTGTFTYSPLAGCNPMTVSFSATTSGASQLIWDMNNGVTQNTTSSTHSYTYTQSGKYVPRLILSDGASCLVPVQGLDTVKVDYIDADFSFSSSGNCISSTVQFTDTVLSALSAVSTRSWNFGDGGTSTAHNPSHVYTTGGTYNIRLIVTNAQGCSDTTIRQIVIYGAPNVTAANDQTICAGTSTPVTITASGASSYTWSPSAGLSCTNCASPTALPSSTTTYVVTGTDTNGCTDTGKVTITVATPPTVTVSPDITICNGTSTNLTASGASSYVWSPSTGLSCTNCATTTASPSTTTVYTVIGSNASGCTDTTLVTVSVSAKPNVSAGGDQTICNGSSVSLTATGANSYVWTPSTGLSCTNCANPTANPTSTTTYVVTGTSGASCTNTDTVTVVVNPKPTVSAGSNVAICNGNATTLTATGAASYTWSPSAGLSCTSCANPTASPSATTTYTVTGTDANGCTNTATVTVTVNSLPNVSAGANVSICNGSSTTLNASGASSYAWSPSTGLSCTSCANPSANPSVTTTYIVTGTDGNGCIDTGVITVTVNPKPTVVAGTSQTICAGGSATLSAAGASSYTWSPSAGLSCSNCSNPVASPSSTTIYTVTGTDANGCTNTATVTITVNPKPTVSAGSNVAICSGNSTTLTATGASTYTWSPSTGLSCTNCANPTANPTSTTTYTVTGTDANGCVNTATVTVTVNNRPNVTASADVTICNGSSTTITGYGASTYTWSPSAGLSCTSCSAPAANPGTTTTYIVTGTDANGCTDTAKVTVTVNPKPTVSAGSNVAVCIGSSATLTATGAVSYAWSPATGLSCTNCAAPVASPVSTTTYTVTGTDANGCTNTSTVTVTVNPKPTVTVNSPTICMGSSATLNATGASTYTWSPAANLSCSNCSSPVASPSATTSYIVTGTDANGCVNTATSTVTVNPLPDVVASGAKTICVGETAQLSATGANTYSWSPATGLSCTNCNNPIAAPVVTTAYTVTGTSNGCSANAFVTVTVRPQPVVTVGGDQEICAGDSTTLNATGATNYNWSPSSGLSCTNCASTVATPSTTTSYSVIGTDINGCKDTAGITVTVNPLPVIDAGADQTICTGSSAYLKAAGGVSYTWADGGTLSCTSCPNPVASPKEKTTYTVVGTDANGCINKDEVTVSVIEKGPVTIGPGDSICKGESVALHASGGSSYSWSPGSGLSDPTSADPIADPGQTTTYTLVVKQGDCFADTGYVTVVVHELPEVTLGDDIYIGGGNATQLDAKTNMPVSYAWMPADYLSCTDCRKPTASPLKTVNYTVTVTNEWGCQDKDDITIHVTCDNSQIFLANTFTPNNDGVNDRFFPQGRGISTVKSFVVYNRWGEIVFSRENMPLNNESAGWDGMYKGAPAKPDVFVYIISAYCESGELLQLKGDISLIR